MAKLNKSEANEAMNARLLNDADVQGANGAELRLMTYEQLRDSARRVVFVNHDHLIENTYPKYREDMVDRATQYVLAVWRRLIESFENTDPTCIAEHEVRSFTYALDYMLSDAQETLARFRKQFDENPAYAFTSTAAVQAAANLEVATRAKSMLERYSVAEVKQSLMDSLRYTFRIDGSTCPMTNLVERAKQVATAKLVGLN
jgi:hypothetical protein